jgi:hypothetical protein
MEVDAGIILLFLPFEFSIPYFPSFIWSETTPMGSRNLQGRGPDLLRLKLQLSRRNFG